MVRIAQSAARTVQIPEAAADCPYIADFFCSDAKLIVELDGSQHGEAENREKDEIRTEFLETRGYKVLRFWNHDLVENFDGVIETIFGAASERRRDTPHPQ